MAITHSSGATVVTGEHIEWYAMRSAIGALELWCKGLKSRRFTPEVIAARFKVEGSTAVVVLRNLRTKWEAETKRLGLVDSAKV